MDDEFIEFQDFVEDFVNLELELEIDEEFANWSLKSYSDSHNFMLKLRFSEDAWPPIKNKFFWSGT